MLSARVRINVSLAVQMRLRWIAAVLTYVFGR